MENGSRNERIKTYQSAGIKLMPIPINIKESKNVARGLEFSEYEVLCRLEIVFTRIY